MKKKGRKVKMKGKKIEKKITFRMKLQRVEYRLHILKNY